MISNMDEPIQLKLSGMEEDMCQSNIAKEFLEAIVVFQQKNEQAIERVVGVQSCINNLTLAS